MADGGMEGYEQLCRFSGDATVAGRRVTIDCLGQRGHSWGAPDWEQMALARMLGAWIGEDLGVSLLAIRPASSDHHDQESIAAYVYDGGEPIRVLEPRLSTGYDGEQRQRRAGLELWVDEESPARRAAGEVVCGTSLDLGGCGWTAPSCAGTWRAARASGATTSCAASPEVRRRAGYTIGRSDDAAAATRSYRARMDPAQRAHITGSCTTSWLIDLDRHRPGRGRRGLSRARSRAGARASVRGAAHGQGGAGGHAQALRPGSRRQPARLPQPTLSRLGELLAEARAGGVQVQLVEQGRPLEVPPGVGLAAYRILQEALRTSAVTPAPSRRPSGCATRPT
jgi:hypothetical protein